MNHMLYSLFAIEFLAIITIWISWFNKTHNDKFVKYLESISNGKLTLHVDSFGMGFEYLLRVLIMYSHIIPISVYVAVEILKLLQYKRI